MTDTGYDFPEYIDADSHELLIDYFKTDYPDEQVQKYMMYNFTNVINGDGARATRSATQSGGGVQLEAQSAPRRDNDAPDSPQRRRRGAPRSGPSGIAGTAVRLEALSRSSSPSASPSPSPHAHRALTLREGSVAAQRSMAPLISGFNRAGDKRDRATSRSAAAATLPSPTRCRKRGGAWPRLRRRS